MNKPAYLFTGEVKAQVENFRGHLQARHLSPDTVRQKTNYAGHFLQWLENERLQPGDVRYDDLLNFIDYCRLEGASKKHVNSKLRAIRDFYGYLKKQTPGTINPAINLNLKGTLQKAPSNSINCQELGQLYNNYKTVTNRDKRNKTMLGLLIYQGLATGELHRLGPGHLKLKEGKIHVPGNRHRNSRTLELKPFQILELHEYITKTRPRILAGANKPKPARKPDKINRPKLENQLFISTNGSENLKSTLLHMFRDIQKTSPNIANARQIRQSTITHWLKNYNLRQVQYMAGHKYIGSTERYQLNDLDNLQSKLEKFHPLNGNF